MLSSFQSPIYEILTGVWRKERGQFSYMDRTPLPLLGPQGVGSKEG